MQIFHDLTVLKSDRFLWYMKTELLYTFLNVTRRGRVISRGLWLWVCNEMRLSYLRLCVQVEIILSIFRFSSSDTPRAKRLCACEKDG